MTSAAGGVGDVKDLYEFILADCDVGASTCVEMEAEMDVLDGRLEVYIF